MGRRRVFVQPGERFGLLVVLREIVQNADESAGNRRMKYVAECACDCGNTVLVPVVSLANTTRVSCGCRRGFHIHKGRLATGFSNRTYFHSARQTAKKRGIPWDLTFEQYDALLKMPCAYCGCHATGADRVDNDRGYVVGNVTPCCPACNHAKHATEVGAYLKWIRTTHAHLSKRGWRVQPPDLRTAGGRLFEVLP